MHTLFNIQGRPDDVYRLVICLYPLKVCETRQGTSDSDLSAIVNERFVQVCWRQHSISTMTTYTQNGYVVMVVPKRHQGVIHYDLFTLDMPSLHGFEHKFSSGCD